MKMVNIWTTYWFSGQTVSKQLYSKSITNILSLPKKFYDFLGVINYF
jgi:hypothetical protein